jgi:PIN domain nuclease of toxin-antitoxin system
MSVVVDASVVLAWLQDEAGADNAEPMLMEGLIGAANWSEVLQKSSQHGAPVAIVARLLVSFGLSVVEVTAPDAVVAAQLWRPASSLSLGDRLCMALGLRLGLPVATADLAWERVDGGPAVIVIR